MLSFMQPYHDIDIFLVGCLLVDPHHVVNNFGSNNIQCLIVLLLGF